MEKWLETDNFEEAFDKFNDNVDEIDNTFGLKANKQQGEWITPTLLNGWTEFSGCSVRYMKDEFGFVHVKGAVSNVGATLPSAALTLPAGYKPNQMIGFSTQANNSAVIPIYITNNGSVVISGASKTAIFLDTISFRAEA